MADDGYKEGWPQDQAALPDTSTNWTLSKALRSYADTVAPAFTPENSSLNLVLDKPAMADIDWTGEHDPANTGAAIYTGLQPYASDPRGPAQDGSDGSGAQLDAHAKPGWIQLSQPGTLEAGEDGSGYYTYGTTPGGRPGSAYQWGTLRTMQVIGAVADRLATGDQYTPFGVGNISLSDGAATGDHKGHRSGLEIDIRPARTDGAQLPVTYKDPQYDRAATQRLVDAFRGTGQVGAVYFNDPRIGGATPLAGHDDHLHIQLKR